MDQNVDQNLILNSFFQKITMLLFLLLLLMMMMLKMKWMMLKKKLDLLFLFQKGS